MARPVFAVLNKKTLSLFENENVNALIKTIPIQGEITTYQPTDWDTLNCFRILDSPREVIKYEQWSNKFLKIEIKTLTAQRINNLSNHQYS